MLLFNPWEFGQEIKIAIKSVGVNMPNGKAEIYYTGNGLNDLIAVTNTDDVTPGEFGDFVF